MQHHMEESPEQNVACCYCCRSYFIFEHLYFFLFLPPWKRMTSIVLTLRYLMAMVEWMLPIIQQHIYM